MTIAGRLQMLTELIKMDDTRRNAEPARKQYGKLYVPGDETRGFKYILWCPTSPECPKYVFNHKPDAIKAAYSMAHRFNGEKFFVCKIEGVAVVDKASFRSFDK